MTLIMGDATHANVAKLVHQNTELNAGYVTGSPTVKWTDNDWDQFHPISRVTIDQGFTGSPVASAMVRDVEAGAWTPSDAIATLWTAPRPTIYCSASTLPQLEAAGWRGDVWVADYVTIIPNAPYPVPAGMRCVAWQWTDLAQGGTVDLSVVFDPYWPQEAPMTNYDAQVWKFCAKCGCQVYSGSGGLPCAAGGTHDLSKSADYPVVAVRP